MNQGNDAKAFRMATLIAWALLVGAPIMYLIIALTLDTKGIQARAGNDVLIYILLIVAMVTPPIIAFGMGFAFKQQGTKAVAMKGSPADKFFSVTIAKLAAVEATFIYGFVCFLLTAKITNMLWFYPIGAIWSFVYWPRRDKYDEFIEKMEMR